MSGWFRDRVLGSVVGLLGLVMVAQSFAQQAPPRRPDAAPPEEPPRASAPQTTVDANLGSDYVIGPGDTLDIFVWRSPELSTTVPVRPDGKISSPLVAEVVASGKTAVQLAHDLEAILGTYIRSPQVNVIVRNALGASSQVRVVGQAANPKAIPYRDGMTVLDVVIAVGGLSEFAAGNRAKIVRVEAGGKSKEIKVKLKKLMESGDMSQNYRMQPGDVLVIPQSIF
jgi:polysaccharide biosynthesis/export protein